MSSSSLLDDGEDVEGFARGGRLAPSHGERAGAGLRATDRSLVGKGNTEGDFAGAGVGAAAAVFGFANGLGLLDLPLE